MKQYFYMAFLSLLAVGTACAQTRKMPTLENAEQFAYKDQEMDFKDEFEQALMRLDTLTTKERMPEEQIKVMIERTKMLLYNRASLKARCIGAMLLQVTPGKLASDELITKAEDCIKQKNAKFFTINMIIDDYVAPRIVTVQAYLRCELRARLLERELMFPPYEFLRPGTGYTLAGKLLDADVLMHCLTENR